MVVGKALPLMNADGTDLPAISVIFVHYLRFSASICGQLVSSITVIW
jgi:hypothetical protein